MEKKSLNIFLDLMQIVENGFIFKLKQKNPQITESEIKEEIKKWYLHRPAAELGDADGIPGDISRFFK